MNYQIRWARESDYKSICDFYELEWKYLQTIENKELFNYYYANTYCCQKDKINFVIVEKNLEIVAACGYICSGNYSGWLSNLLVKKGENFALVFDIILFFKEEGLSISGANITEKSRVIYQRLGYYVGELGHHYIVTASKANIISGINGFKCDKQSISITAETECGEPIDLDSIIKSKNNLFEERKNFDYFYNRFFCFPIKNWKYRMWGVKDINGRVISLFVFRIQNVQGTNVLRIVDFYGNVENIPKITKGLYKLACDSLSEYIDFWCYGIDEKILDKAQFRKVDNNKVIIPDKLDPIEHCNETIFFFHDGVNNFKAFRADGDNDRPNICTQ